MKANLLLFILLLVAFGASAQSTTPDNVPPAGSTLLVNPFHPFGVDAGTDGNDREYNFSYVKSLPVDTLHWRAMDEVGRSFFPNAGLTTNYYDLYRQLYQAPGFQSPYIPKGFMETSYLTTDGEGLKILGNANEFTFNTTANGDTFVFLPQSAAFSQPRLTLPFGMKYGDRKPTQTVTQEFFGGRIRGNRVDTFRVVRSITTTIQADAQGRLSTPSTYYPSVVRIRTDITEVDSLFLNNGFFIEKYELNRFNPTQYSWFVPNRPWEVATVIYDGKNPIYGNYILDTFQVSCNFGELRRDVKENVGVIKVPVILTQPAPGPVTVTLNTYYPAPEATPFVDFVPINNMSLTFEPGETFKMVEVAILDDSLMEEDEYFALGIDEITPNAKIGTIDRFLVKILDDDVPVLYFASTDTTVRETAISDSSIYYIPIHVSRPIADSVEVHFQTLERTAKADSDFVNVNYSVTLLPNQSVIYFPIQILNDDYNEETEYFVLRMSRVSKNARVGISDTMRIYILDDDFRPNVRFFSDYVETPEATNEPGNVFTVPIRISYPASEPITVHVRTHDETAIGDVDDSYPNGGDYVSVDKEVHIHPFDTVGYVSIPIHNDLLVNGDRTFIVKIEGISDNAQFAIINQAIRVKILNNDPFVSAEKTLVLEEVKLYPNPNQGIVHISLPENTHATSLVLSNALGQSISLPFQESQQQISADLDGAGLTNGIYVVQLTTDKGIVSHRLILQR